MNYLFNNHDIKNSKSLSITNLLKVLAVGLFMVSNYSIQAQDGAALDLDNSNDYVTLGTNLHSHFSGANQITLEGWINPRSTGASWRTIIADHNWGAGTAQRWTFRLHNHSFISLQIWTTAGGPICLGATPIPHNTWTHVATTWDGSTVKVYVNGVLDGSIGLGGHFGADVGNTATIGADYYPGATQEYWNGQLDEIRVWDYALTAEEIQASMNCELNGDESGLVANYQFNEGTAGGSNAGVTTLPDVTGNASNNGTLTNFALNGPSSNWVAPGGVETGTLCNPPEAVPTMGEWALIIFALIILSLGTVSVMRWQRVQQLQYE